MMASVNITIRVEEETKRQFDAFCDNVGMNMTTALNMFIKDVLRNRQLPFTVTDVDARSEILSKGKEALVKAQEQSVAGGTSEMTMEEIDAEIRAYRAEKRASEKRGFDA